MAPTAGFGDVWYALALHRAGRHDEEVAFKIQNYRSRGQEVIAAAFEEGYLDGGHEEAARRVARALIDQRDRRFVGGLQIAVPLVEVGEYDEAVRWLRTEVGEHGRNVPYFGVLPPLWPLHDHSGFRALLSELGIETHRPVGT